MAEMSCIAGVGGDVPQLLKLAHSGRPIIALDGCPLFASRAVWHGTACIPHGTMSCTDTE